MSYEAMKERYNNDVHFRSAVDMMASMIERGILTPHDVARVAVFAAIVHAMRHREPVMVVLQEPRWAHRRGRGEGEP